MHVLPQRQRARGQMYEEQLLDLPLNYNDAVSSQGEEYKGRAQREGKITCHSLMNVLGKG